MSKIVTYNRKNVAELLPKRVPDSNKGTYGRVAVIAGSVNMAGACLLASEAAYRTGVGLVKVYAPLENRIIVQNGIPEAVLYTYDTKEPLEFRKLVDDVLGFANAVVIGPGLAHSSFYMSVFGLLANEFDGPIVVDAGALNYIPMLSGMESRKAKIVITPHMKEMSVLTGVSVAEIKEDKQKIAKEYADCYGISVVLKDHETVIVDSNSEEVYINNSGNDGMSTGGSGDVLSGIIGGLLAQGMNPTDAARLGVYIHGLAGDAAAEKLGSRYMLARDIIASLSDVIK